MKTLFFLTLDYIKSFIFKKNEIMREHFPLLKECLYFNTAYTAPLSQALMQWREEDDNTYLKTGDGYKLIHEKHYLEEARKALSAFAGAEEHYTFITSNFSSAFQNFLIQLPPHFRFLSLKEEYPSLTGVIEDLNFKTTLLPITAKVEEAIWQELHQNDYEVLALSAIQYSTGLYFDFAYLEKIKKAFPALIILIDGTQFLGAESFSLTSSPVDAIFGSTYKWLMAGHGTGYALFSSQLIERLHFNLEKLSSIYDRGQLSVKAIGSLLFSMEQLLNADFEHLMQHKKALTTLLFEGLKKRQLLDQTTLDRKKHSSIFTIQVNEEVYQKLLKNNVRCIQRGLGVRLSVHHYNNKEDIASLMALLDDMI